MKKTEITFVILLLIGLTFKYFLLPLSGLITTLSVMTLSILYYFFSFAYFNQIKLRDIFKKDSYNGISIPRIIGSVATGIGISTSLIGILFKVQNWPMANNSLIAGLILSLLILIIVAIKFIKTKASFYYRILLRVLTISIVGLFFLATSELDLIKIQFRNHPSYIKAYELHKEDPQNDSLRENLDLELKKTFMDDKTFNAYKEYLDSKSDKKILSR